MIQLYEKAFKETEKTLKKFYTKQFLPSEVASAAVFIARITCGFIQPWNARLELLTGCSEAKVQQISKYILTQDQLSQSLFAQAVAEKKSSVSKRKQAFYCQSLVHSPSRRSTVEIKHEGSAQPASKVLLSTHSKNRSLERPLGQ